MTDKTYRIRIVRGDQHFEVEGDKGFVLDMLKRFEAMVGVIPPPTRKGTERAQKQLGLTATVKALSPGEFIRLLGFKRHTDIVLAFGYYLEEQKGIKDFTPTDINNVYYEAKMENSNTSQMCVNNVRKGFMMDAKRTKKGGRKRYTLTRSGEDYVKNRLTESTK